MMQLGPPIVFHRPQPHVADVPHSVVGEPPYLIQLRSPLGGGGGHLIFLLPSAALAQPEATPPSGMCAVSEVGGAMPTSRS